MTVIFIIIIILYVYKRALNDEANKKNEVNSL